MLKEGTGISPEAKDQVEVHYTGTLLDGTKLQLGKAGYRHHLKGEGYGRLVPFHLAGIIDHGVVRLLYVHGYRFPG